MTQTLDYLISTEEGEFHRLKLSWSGDRSLLYVSSNFRTMGMTRSMAQELQKGLTALLSGPFDRALSELELRMEIEDAKNREARASRGPDTTPNQPRTTTNPPAARVKPELDML